ncbi:MAG: DNA primase [Nitrospirae bacterium]|nr:DNA primase [Candidatus Manganitrophaceae bacterium]
MDQHIYSNQVLETVRERSDLLSVASEYLTLKKSGQNYSALCPFHEEKTASFNINPIKQFFHCFGCGAGGDVFQFVSQIEGLSFPETLRQLAERADVSLAVDDSPKAVQARSETEEIYRANAAAAEHLHRNLISKPEGASARTYLEARGLSNETIRDFSVGYALSTWDDLVKKLRSMFSPSILEKAGLISKRAERAQKDSAHFDRFRDRVMFPIRNPQGKVLGFGGRVFGEGEPKYLNTAETPVFRKSEILFGLDRPKVVGQPLVIVEGYLDVITAIQAGIPNVVATLGTALTRAHLRLARRHAERIVIVFDGDAAGIRAALRTAPLLIDEEMPVSIATLPSGIDPDAFIREHGKAAFLLALETASSVMDFCITQSILSASPKTVSDKMAVIRQVLPFVRRLHSEVEKSDALRILSDRLLLRETDVRFEYLRLARQEKKSPLKPSVENVEKQVEVLPHDQETLLILLLQGLLEPEALNGKLHLDDFTHPLIQRVISSYWSAKNEVWCGSDETDFRILDASAQSLFSRLTVIDVLDLECVSQIGADCVNMLQRKKIDRRRSEIEHQLKKVTGDLEAAKVLKKKIMDLSRASSNLTVSH